MNRLELHDLTIGYSPAKVLFQNLQMAVPDSTLVSFMGSNGVGKSTLLKTIAGLQSPLHGAVHIDGQPVVAGQGLAAAIVLTQKLDNLSMTVKEFVTFGRYPYLSWNLKLSPTDEQHIEESLELLQINHLQKQYLFQLSDGQRQLASIARALAQDTPLVILDEPTAHLDLNHRLEVMQVLRSLTRTTGKTLLVSTHELDLALQVSDWLWLALPDQRIVEGIPEQLVLDGVFDLVFTRKGFDLKTGRVAHRITRQRRIQVVGQEYRYLWTRNALERSGFELVDTQADDTVYVEDAGWRIGEKSFDSLVGVLAFLT